MTHKRLLVAVVLLAASGVLAQTANVIELSPVDATRAQKAWVALQNAEVEWKAVRSEIKANYATPPCKVKGCTLTLPVKGFSDDFEFSKDFKVIVPKPQTWTTITGTNQSTYPPYCWTTPTCVGTGCTFKYQ